MAAEESQDEAGTRRRGWWLAAGLLALLLVLGSALAEFERDLIRERTQAGLTAARAQGRLGGRPRALDARKTQIAQAFYTDKTASIADICRTLRVSRATLLQGPQ